MSAIDRRRFLARSAALALGAGVAPGWRVVERAAAASADPRLAELARMVSGPVITPSSAAYSSARQVYNQRYGGTMPLAIVRPASVRDVQTVVRWAVHHGIRLAARSGGHSYAGYSSTTGVVVDMSSFSGVSVDRASGTATVGAGTRLVDLYAGLARRGLTVPGGSCPTVGVGGLALGGGLGLAARRFGTTSDNIASLAMVTADGRALVCDGRRNSDLYWASRGGGGGNFGIVTGLRFQTHAVSGASYFFASFPWSAVGAVVPAWLSWAPGATENLYSICSLAAGSEPTLNVFGQYFGPPGQLSALLRPLTRHARPSSLSTGAAGYLALQLRWAGCLGKSLSQCRLPQPVAFAGKSDYVNRPLSAAAVATIARSIERRQGSGALIMDSYGGAINQIAPSATAFVHRSALCSLQYYTSWGSSAAQASSLAWIRGFYKAMRPYVSGFAYQNYIDPDLADWQQAYYGSNLSRLVAIKGARDPENVFRFAQSIPLSRR